MNTYYRVISLPDVVVGVGVVKTKLVLSVVVVVVPSVVVITVDDVVSVVVAGRLVDTGVTVVVSVTLMVVVSSPAQI